MKRKQVWRYYCEHCGKGGCSASHMRDHEDCCTANPNRFCNLHVHTGEDQPSIPELIAALTSCGENWKNGMNKLREVSHNCPVCILSALRQSGRGIEIESCLDEGFDYKRELKAFWDDLEEWREATH